MAVGAMLAPAPVLAQAEVNARVEISAAVAGSSATAEAIERQARSESRVYRQRITTLETQLVEARAQGAAEVERLQTALVEAREALVADLASRDRAYAEEIAVFRREVTDIASTPEGAAALARYNAGDRVGAIAVLDRLRQSRDSARQTRADIESAAEARRIATLALDARGKSDPAFDTGAVIARYEEVVRLDPGVYNDWLQLVQLYIAAGRRADARAAAARLEALATNDRDRATALSFKADVIEEGYSETLGLYERSLEIRLRLYAEDPASVELALELSASLARVADYVPFGDYVIFGYDRLGLYRRSLEISQRLADSDPSSVSLARSVSVSLDRIGRELFDQGNYDEALSLFLRSLEIKQRLSAADPTSVLLAMELSESLKRLSIVLVGQGDTDGALSLYRRQLEMLERLYAADPASAVLARETYSTSWRIGEMTGERRHYERALAILRALEARGVLSDLDQNSISWIEAGLAGLGAPAN